MQILLMFVRSRFSRIGLCFFGLAVFVLSVGLAHPSPTSGVDSPSDGRPISSYRSDVRAFLKLSRSNDGQIERNAIYNLCQLHSEMVADERFPSSENLKSFRAMAAKRLKRYVRDLEREKAKAERAEKKNRSKNGGYYSNQRGSHSGDNGGEAAGSGSTDLDMDWELGDGRDEEVSGGSNRSDVNRDRAFYDSSAESYYSMGQFSGGPSQLFGFAGGRMAPPWDHGDELVALIENTIRPASWKTNGGNGTIQYYRPLRILVVGASMQVQNEMNDLLLKLRAAGR